MTKVMSQLIVLTLAASSGACAGIGTQTKSTVVRPYNVGLAVNDDLWVGKSEKPPSYRIEVKSYALQDQEGDLWMQPDVPATHPRELEVSHPRLNAYLNRVTPSQLAASSSSQRRAF